jgi:hypothetical protein
MSVGDRHFTFSPSGLPNAADLDRAIQIKLKQWTVVTGCQIPYAAGYSTDGTKIYVDELVPEFWEDNGRRIKIWHGSLFEHESSEKDELDKYGDEHYDGAHTFGTFREWTYVRANGGNVDRYNAWWEPILKRCAARDRFVVPADLDLTPYHDDETAVDRKLLSRMTFRK